MRRMLLLFLLISLMFYTASAQMDDNLRLQLEVRFANLDRIAKALDVSMDALASYIASINGDTSKLKEFKSGFESKAADLKTAKSNLEIDSKAKATAEKVGFFWEEYKVQFDANNGNLFLALKQLSDALKAAKPELDSMTGKYWQVRKDNALQIYDNDVEAAQKIVDLLQKYKCKTQMDSKLEEIKSSRSELESALYSKNEIQIINTQSKIILLAQQLGDFAAGKC